MMTTNGLLPSAKLPGKTLVVLVGPTAIGKTSLAIKIAQYFNTAILSADSRQFFNELKIGTAAPTIEEQSLVQHFFAGHLSMHDYYNVADFEREVLDTLDKLFIEKDVAVLTGGSGLYIDAVCSGIDDMPDQDLAVRAQIDNWYREHGIDFLCEKLAGLDPEYFKIVDKANPNRLKRAIEVCLETGKTFTSFRVREIKPRPFNIIKIGINRPRAELFADISTRTDAMMESGLLDEVRSMLPYRDLNALNTVGYKELFEYFDAKVTLDRAIENIKTNTRRYAKRQLTWFKRDKELRWFLPSNLTEIIAYINEVISGKSSRDTF